MYVGLIFPHGKLFQTVMNFFPLLFVVFITFFTTMSPTAVTFQDCNMPALNGEMASSCLQNKAIKYYEDGTFYSTDLGGSLGMWLPVFLSIPTCTFIMGDFISHTDNSSKLWTPIATSMCSITLTTFLMLSSTILTHFCFFVCSKQLSISPSVSAKSL